MTDDVHALSGLYAVDALEEHDRQRFEAHLRRCPDCASEVAELQGTAARLGATAASPPPPGLQALVLADVTVTRQDRRPDVLAARRPVWLGRAVLGAAAALVLLIGLLGARVISTDHALDRADDVNRVLTAPDASTARLDGSTGIHARVVGSSSLGRAVVVLDGLSPVPDDRAYALWLIGANGPEPVGLVRPDSADRAVALVDADVARYGGFGVTLEPRRGSVSPTGPLLVSGAPT